MRRSSGPYIGFGRMPQARPPRRAIFGWLNERRHSLRQKFRPRSRRGEGGRARHPRLMRRQCEPVHLQGDGHLYRRARPCRDHRSGPGRRQAHCRLARRDPRRDRHAYFRHAYASRSFAGGAAYREGDRRQDLWRRPASRLASAQYRRTQSARCQRGYGFPSRCRAHRRRDRQRQGLHARSDHHAGPHRQPHGLCAQGIECAVLRRSCDGLVDLDRRAAGRRDERLHEFAAQADRPHGRDLLSRPRQSDQGRAAFRAQLHPPSRRPRGIDPAPARKRRGRYPDAGARDLYRDRSAAHGRGRASRCWRIWKIWSRAGSSTTDGAPSIAGVYRLGA